MSQLLDVLTVFRDIINIIAVIASRKIQISLSKYMGIIGLKRIAIAPNIHNQGFLSETNAVYAVNPAKIQITILKRV